MNSLKPQIFEPGNHRTISESTWCGLLKSTLNFANIAGTRAHRIIILRIVEQFSEGSYDTFAARVSSSSSKSAKANACNSNMALLMDLAALHQVASDGKLRYRGSPNN